MRRPLLPLILISLFALPAQFAPAQATSAPTTAPAAKGSQREDRARNDKQDPTEPAMRYSTDGQPFRFFTKKHEGFLARTKEGPVDLLFLGDSITDFWRDPNRGKPVWDERYGKLNAANFGLSADRTQHVLWRIDNGELDGIHPKVVVLMIGTNNHNLSAADISRGTTAVVHAVQKKLPDTKILLLGIFPRDEHPDGPDRAKLKEANDILSKLNDGQSVFYLDIGDKFLQPDGTLPKSLFPDSLHPNTDGYKIWADAIQPKLDELMK